MHEADVGRLPGEAFVGEGDEGGGVPTLLQHRYLPGLEIGGIEGPSFVAA